MSQEAIPKGTEIQVRSSPSTEKRTDSALQRAMEEREDPGEL